MKKMSDLGVLFRDGLIGALVVGNSDGKIFSCLVELLEEYQNQADELYTLLQYCCMHKYNNRVSAPISPVTLFSQRQCTYRTSITDPSRIMVIGGVCEVTSLTDRLMGAKEANDGDGSNISTCLDPSANS